MTLEELQAENLRLNEALAEANLEKENYSARVNELETDLEKVRNLNQQYFLKLSAQYKPNQTEEPEEPEAPTCEDFAKNLTI